MSNFRRFSRGVRGSLGYDVSSDDEDTELNPATGIRRKRQARSPSPRSQARSDAAWREQIEQRVLEEQQAQAAHEQASIRREAAMVRHNNQIDAMVRSISTALGTNVDVVDPRIRFVIGQIVNVHGLTLHSLSLMRRSTILLSAIGDIATRAGRGLVNAGDVVYSAGQAALAALRAAGSFTSRGASAAASGFSSLLSRFSRQPARSRGQRARSPDSFLQEQSPPNLGFQEVLFSSQAPTLEQQSQMDRMLQLQLSPASASAFGRQPLPSQAPPPPPAPAPAVEEEDECSICMEPARDNAVLTRCNHRFHGACVTPWLNSHRTCPMCRNTNPTPLVPAPAKRQRQGGGGSRKTRSKSKTRRLRKSRNKYRKPRKSCKSRKQKSSSYRRK